MEGSQVLALLEPVVLALLVGGGLWLLMLLVDRAQSRRPGMKAHVKSLYCYPVKSCAGIALKEATLTANGIEHDREWIICRAPVTVGQVVQMVTIREYRKMCLIKPTLTDGELTISTPDGKSIAISPPSKARQIEVLVWRTTCRGIDQGSEVSQFLTDYFGCPQQPVLLLRMPDSDARKLCECAKYVHIKSIADASDGGGTAKFTDWAQFNMLSSSSLRWLNTRCAPNDYSALHFRTNIEVETSGSAPFQEETWERFNIGSTNFQFLKHTGRCIIPNINPQTSERNKRSEPLPTLLKLRGSVYDFLPDNHASRDNKEAFFAVGGRHFFEPGQKLRVGDQVCVSEFRVPKFFPPRK